MVYDGKIPLKTYKQYIQGGPASESIFCNTTQIDQALNIVVAKAARKDATENFGTFRRGDNRYYLKVGADNLGRGLVANRGYFSTIKPATSNAIINVNITMSTFFKPMLLSNFIEPFGAENLTKLERILKSLKIRIEYTRGKDSEADIDSEERRIEMIWDLGRPVQLQPFKKEENGGMKDISVKSCLKKSELNS